VLIKNGDVDKATLSYYQKTKNPIDTSVKDGQLTINDNNSELDSTSNKHINFFGLKDLVRLSTLNEEVRNKTIVITLPKKQTIDFLDSDHTLFTNSDLSIAMGDYSGDNLIFNGHNKLDVTSGDIEIALKDYTLNVQADSHSGEVDITNNLKISKDNTLTITSDLGDITVE